MIAFLPLRWLLPYRQGMAGEQEQEPDLGMVAEVVRHVDREQAAQGRQLGRLVGQIDRLTDDVAALREGQEALARRVNGIAAVQDTTVELLQAILQRLPERPA